MKFKTLLAVSISAICAASMANAHEHKHDHMAPAGALVEVS